MKYFYPVLLILLTTMTSCGGSNDSQNYDAPEVEKTINPENIVRSGEAFGNRFFIDNYSKDTLFNGRIFHNCRTNFRNGYAWITELIDGVEKYGVINLKGEDVIPCKFDGSIGDYEEGGYFQIHENGLTGYIDSTGSIILPTIYYESKGVNDGIVTLQGEKWKWGMMTMNGNTIVPFEYDNIGYWSNDRAIVKKTNRSDYTSKHAYVDKKGELICEMEYDDASNFQNGIALVEKNGKIGIIDKDNNVVIDFIYHNYKTLTVVYESNITLSGTESYSEGFVSKEGYIIVEGDNGWGYINTKGEEVISCEYDVIGVAKDNKVDVEKDGKKGTYDIRDKKVDWWD